LSIITIKVISNPQSQSIIFIQY